LFVSHYILKKRSGQRLNSRHLVTFFAYARPESDFQQLSCLRKLLSFVGNLLFQKVERSETGRFTGRNAKQTSIKITEPLRGKAEGYKKKNKNPCEKKTVNPVRARERTVKARRAKHR